MRPDHALLLDTHVVIWMATDPGRLPTALLKAIETVPTRYVSHVSAWEIQIKQEKHGFRFNFTLPQLERTMKAFRCSELAVEYRDIRGLDRLRFTHPDPFDRLLVSQAASRPVYLATLDYNIVKAFEEGNPFRIFTDRAREQ